ncbi:hypothetical protein [Neobacillus niacini]|uniref:hypothetical protein n=1 Tax=Neobacillus niacini TaxID=86668 RepID=UPI00286C62F3|nr:hypothetical protein [Neobacillus niacini]
MGQVLIKSKLSSEKYGILLMSFIWEQIESLKEDHQKQIVQLQKENEDLKQTKKNGKKGTAAE